MVYGKDAAGRLLGGVYCAIIAVKSVIISAAIFRVFGRLVAEIPLVAIREKYRGNDCFRFLFSLVEQILSSLEVEYIIVPTTKDMLSLWTDKLGFSEIAEERLKAYLMEHPLMMFEPTTILEKAIVREPIAPSQQETMSTQEHAPKEAQLEGASQLEEATLAEGGHIPKEMEIDEVCPIKQEETTSAEGDHVPKEIDTHEAYAMELILPSQQEAKSAAGGHATEEVEVDEVPPTFAKGGHLPKEMEIDEVCPIEQEETTSADGDHVPKEIDMHEVHAMELILPNQQEATSTAGGHATEEVEVQLAEQHQQDKARAAQGDLALPEIEIHEVYKTDLIVPGQQEATSAARRHAPEEIEVQVVYPDQARVSRQHEAASTKGEHGYQEIEARQVCQIEMESVVPNQHEAASVGGHAPEEMMAQELNPKDPIVPSQQEAMSPEGQKLVPIMPSQQEATSAKIKAQQVYQRRKRGVPSQHESTSAEEVKHSTKEVEVDKVYQRRLRRKWRGASAPDS